MAKPSAEPLAFLKGTLDMMVLKALSGGPMHGFGIALWLESRSSGQLGLDDSFTYQVLHRLEGRGLVDAEWTVTENNRRARVYKLTRAGRSRLARETDVWLRYSEVVTAIMTVDPRPASG
ncbi:MAG TPA: PadR family transcriptional regulator [Gemmatimonadaceae bacterium]|nr:PadR family transcriptional regulator [Gemmatimonadaceae bacterium]